MSLTMLGASPTEPFLRVRVWCSTPNLTPAPVAFPSTWDPGDREEGQEHPGAREGAHGMRATCDACDMLCHAWQHRGW